MKEKQEIPSHNIYLKIILLVPNTQHSKFEKDPYTGHARYLPKATAMNENIIYLKSIINLYSDPITAFLQNINDKHTMTLKEIV